jgi:hypothetical protein
VDYSCRVIAALQAGGGDQRSNTGANPLWHVFENNNGMALETDTMHT